MFERFTERARRVIVRSLEETHSCNHHAIGSEHFTVALSEEDTVAGEILSEFGITAAAVRDELRRRMRTGDAPLSREAHIPFAPSAKAVLENTHRRSVALGDDYIGTAHLLLGVLDEERHSGGLLVDLGADLDAIDDRVREVLANKPEKPSPPDV